MAGEHLQTKNRWQPSTKPPMLNFLMRQKTSWWVSLFFSPWLLLLLSPIISSSTDSAQKAMLGVFIIFWLQGVLFFIFTFWTGERLILKANGHYHCMDKKSFLLHSLFNFLFFTMTIGVCIANEWRKTYDISAALMLFLLFISELFRTHSFSKLLVSLERKREVGWKDYLATFYLSLVPICGIWNIHPRVVNLLTDKND
jgi:hypothetical protein